MSSIKLKGSTSGEITISAPAVAGTNTLTLPAETGTVLTTNNFDLNGQELILDADGDTSITADTDDQIDIKVGGTDRMTIDSNGKVDLTSIGLKLGGSYGASIYRSNLGSSGAGFHFSINSELPIDGNSALSDNVMSLGDGSRRHSVVYAGTGSINTSDENEKQDIESLSQAELNVATAIKGLVKKFRWIDSVETKGDDARIHVGVIAQEVKAAFEAEGLDAHRYAMFCSDTWYEVDGEIMGNDGIRYTSETEGAVERTRLGIRYEELLAFVIAAI